ncbi:MAG TPA: Xaa-Pro peptidase family protein [Candidatus Babeliaceae bacterium]|nr:Xaa-Pro peptidase family protein [Candidatus Babeliaceae bacterium]
MRKDGLLFKERRQRLVSLLQEQALMLNNADLIVLISNFECSSKEFRQESSFYYLTGIVEPGTAITIDNKGYTTLYIPQCSVSRAQWLSSDVQVDDQTKQRLNVDAIEYLGDPCKGYQISPLFSEKEYNNLLSKLEKVCNTNGILYVLNSESSHEYIEQKQALARIVRFKPLLETYLKNISPIVAKMRRKKSKREIEGIYKAIELTLIAQEAAACVISEGTHEQYVKAGIEYIFAEAGARSAFPSIVAAGKSGTILHHTPKNIAMKKGDLVIVDIGAEVDYYCADITRTYPVSGTFNKRQRELYKIVLETQEYIASLVKPGVWLNNAEHPDKSLQHLAKKFLEKKGYGNYFVHGIGHFLGLDVHDVGNANEPIQEGDVITIEPGIYIPQEEIGIRIEDDYWVIKDGVICLSNELPKDVDSIEAMAQGTLEVDDAEEEDDSSFN